MGLFFYPSRIIYPSHLFAQSVTFKFVPPRPVMNTLSTLLGLKVAMCDSLPLRPQQADHSQSPSPAAKARLPGVHSRPKLKPLRSCKTLTPRDYDSARWFHVRQAAAPEVEAQRATLSSQSPWLCERRRSKRLPATKQGLLAAMQVPCLSELS